MEEKVVLLIEDNPDDVLLTKRAFLRQNFSLRIEVARDGHEALERLLGGEHLLPDLILLDLKIPKLGGLDVLRRIRSDDLTKYIPVVVLTSSSEEVDILSSYDLGANSFLQKPVDFDKFVETAKEIGLYWLYMNRPVTQ